MSAGVHMTLALTTLRPFHEVLFVGWQCVVVVLIYMCDVLSLLVLERSCSMLFQIKTSFSLKRLQNKFNIQLIQFILVGTDICVPEGNPPIPLGNHITISHVFNQNNSGESISIASVGQCLHILAFFLHSHTLTQERESTNTIYSP